MLIFVVTALQCALEGGERMCQKEPLNDFLSIVRECEDYIKAHMGEASIKRENT